MITATGLVKRYGPSVALDGLSLSVPSGACLALLGPNGAGKTTLLRIVATLLRPSAGALRIAGVDALRDPEAARRRLAMVGHGTWVYEDLTALENLRFWARLGGAGADDERLRAALAAVDLEPVAEERARTFSSGMKRRLALARVTLRRPDVLLLDEPFTGLDRQGRKWLTEFLLGYRAGGGTVALSTHSFGDALAVADRLAILIGGRLALERPADLTRDELRRVYDEITEGGSAA